MNHPPASLTTKERCVSAMADFDTKAAPVYELRVRFKSPGDLGRAIDLIIPRVGLYCLDRFDEGALEGSKGEPFVHRTFRDLTPQEEAEMWGDAGHKRGGHSSERHSFREHRRNRSRGGEDT